MTSPQGPPSSFSWPLWSYHMTHHMNLETPGRIALAEGSLINKQTNQPSAERVWPLWRDESFLIHGSYSFIDAVKWSSPQKIRGWLMQPRNRGGNMCRCSAHTLPGTLFISQIAWKNETLGLAWHKFRSKNMAALLHRCHCSCCCLQCVWSSVWLAPCSPVRTRRWSSLCSPARYTTPNSLLLKCPSSQMHRDPARS